MDIEQEQDTINPLWVYVALGLYFLGVVPLCIAVIVVMGW